MVLHPDIQDKARRELDNVVGRERLPRITDNDNLTYVKSLITEVLRTGKRFLDGYHGILIHQ